MIRIALVAVLALTVAAFAKQIVSYADAIIDQHACAERVYGWLNLNDVEDFVRQMRQLNVTGKALDKMAGRTDEDWVNLDELNELHRCALKLGLPRG